MSRNLLPKTIKASTATRMIRVLQSVIKLDRIQGQVLNCRAIAKESGIHAYDVQNVLEYVRRFGHVPFGLNEIRNAQHRGNIPVDQVQSLIRRIEAYPKSGPLSPKTIERRERDERRRLRELARNEKQKAKYAPKGPPSETAETRRRDEVTMTIYLAAFHLGEATTEEIASKAKISVDETAETLAWIAKMKGADRMIEKKGTLWKYVKRKGAAQTTGH